MEGRKKERKAEEMERPGPAFEPDKRRSGCMVFFSRPPTSPCLRLSFTGRARPCLSPRFCVLAQWMGRGVSRGRRGTKGERNY